MNKQTRKDYDDVYKAMSNDTDARQRLIDRGLIPANAKLVDLYHLEATLADKLTTSGDNYVEVLAARAEEEAEIEEEANTGKVIEIETTTHENIPAPVGCPLQEEQKQTAAQRMPGF